MTGAAKYLKQSANRSVRLERRAEGAVVVKRFEQRSSLGRAFDGARARREVRLLEHLGRAGVDVPRPLGVRRSGRGFEVELEWIEGAQSLAELCRAGAPLSVELARRAGRMLAGLHRARVDHPDLHAGNLLVGPAGRLVAIDFDKARLARRITDAHVARDLASLCAGLREATRPAWRAIAFAAWWDGLGEEARAGLRRPDALSIERRARALRFQVVAARARRWTRPGSAVTALEGVRGFARVGAAAEDVARALDGAASPRWLRVHGARKQVLDTWRWMARLEEHALGAPRCWLLRPGEPAEAWFEVDTEQAPPTPHSRGRFVGALTDRGIEAHDLAPEAIGAAGLLQPRVFRPLTDARAARVLADGLAHTAAGDRAEFLRGVSEAWRGPRGELAALLARVRDA